MKLHPSLSLLIFAVTAGAVRAESSVTSTSYPGLFGPVSDVTVKPTLSGLATVKIGGTATGSLGTYWNATANGGAVVGLSVLSIVNTGAQVALTGDSLQFNISNDPSSVLGALGVGTSLSLDWSATATFNSSTAPLNLLPNTTYRVTFEVDTGSGLLNSTLGITPSFGVSLIDSANNVVSTTTNTTVANILGLPLGTVVNSPTTGQITVDFKTGASVGTGAAKLRFTGSAVLPVSLVNIGSHFATISKINVVPQSPYVIFIQNSSVTDPVQQDPNADPDGDGRTNLAEFAVDSNPGMSDGGNITYGVGDPDGAGSDTSSFVMTLPVRDGAVFSTSTSGNNADVATVDGVTYEVQGSFDLVNWTLAVSEVTDNSSFTSGLPALGSGWTYRSFRVPGQTTTTPKAFLRVKFY